MNINQAHDIIDSNIKLGRWDNIWKIFSSSEFEAVAFDTIAVALSEKNRSCAKLLPRERSNHKSIAVALRKHLNLTAKQYRILIVSLST